MKRAFTQKVGSVPSCATDNEVVNPYSLANSDRTGSELVRQVRASATTIGLAIAMAASGMLLTQKHHKVLAAEEFGVANTTEAAPGLGSVPEKDASKTSKVSAPSIQSGNEEKSVKIETAKVSLPTNAVEEPTPIVARADLATGTRTVEITTEMKTAEVSLPTNVVAEPTPIVARATTQPDAGSLPRDGSKVSLLTESQTIERSATASEETVGLTPQSLTSRELVTTSIVEQANGNKLAKIGESYHDSDTQSTLNSLEEAPTKTEQRAIASDTVKAVEEGLQAEIDELSDGAASSTSSVQEASNNELQAEIEDLQGTEVRTLVAQTVPISVPDPDNVATASPAPQSGNPLRQVESEVSSVEAIEIVVPKPENRNNSAAKLGIQRSIAQPRRIPLQNQPNAPVSIRQADSLSSQAEAIEIPVPKPATNFVPNRSNPERLATAPLGADEYNSDIPSSPQDGDRFINPSDNVSYGWPVNGRITSGFGKRWGRLHAGIDFGVPTGTPVYASAPGVVIRSGWVGGYGNLVEIRHPNGSVTRYGHNSQLMMQPGQEVNQGEVIALSGNTGRSTGPHVHFEIRPDGKQAVNPITLLPRRA